MELLFIFLTSVALGIDSLVAMFILSKSCFSYTKAQILCLSLVIGIFHFFMPLLGGLLSIATFSFIHNFSSYVSSAVFLFLGIKMIYESARNIDIPIVSTIWKILLLGYLLSVDALASGFSYSIIGLDISIFIVASLFAVGAFLMSLLGFYLGKRILFFNSRIGYIIGGVVLIILGLKNLL